MKKNNKKELFLVESPDKALRYLAEIAKGYNLASEPIKNGYIGELVAKEDAV